MADGENIDATVSSRLDDTDLVPGAALGNEAISEAAIGETPLYHSAQAKSQLDLDAGTLFLTAAEIKGGHPGITFLLPHILALDAALGEGTVWFAAGRAHIQVQHYVDLLLCTAARYAHIWIFIQ
jgi:hypothetical protein